MVFFVAFHDAFTIVAVLFLMSFCGGSAWAEDKPLPALSVDTSGRYLVQATDTASQRPFFWLADTAWYMDKLCSTGDDNDVDRYFADRAARGFNVVQGPILIRMDADSGELQWDCHGAQALEKTSSGILRLNDAHFEHIDRIVASARAHGMYIALPVMWGQTYAALSKEVELREAYWLGKTLGQRYDFNHVIWIVSGEYHKVGRDPENSKALNAVALRTIQAVAHGLAAGHGGRLLMTVHPDAPRSSSEHWHEADWLDFHMVQTYEVWRGSEGRVLRDVSLSPGKPVVNAEPAYEARDTGKKRGLVTAKVVRYEAYHSVFEGAFGHSYGHTAIWHMGEQWSDALDSEGGNDMRHLRRLMASRPADRAHDEGMILKGSGDYVRHRKLRGTIADDGRFALVYFPERRRARLDLSRMRQQQLQAWWFNPRDGLTYDANGQRSDKPFLYFDKGVRRFRPPTSGDWVLVIDDSQAGFGVPGERLTDAGRVR